MKILDLVWQEENENVNEPAQNLLRRHFLSIKLIELL